VCYLFWIIGSINMVTRCGNPFIFVSILCVFGFSLLFESAAPLVAY
jgi:hypothetical protein